MVGSKKEADSKPQFIFDYTFCNIISPLVILFFMLIAFYSYFVKEQGL